MGVERQHEWVIPHSFSLLLWLVAVGTGTSFSAQSSVKALSAQKASPPSVTSKQSKLPPLKCLEGAPPVAPNFPARLPVGVETIHRDEKKVITIYLPLAPEGVYSRIMDTNSKKATESLPQKFVVSDGTIWTAFVGVDRAPGSRLDRCVAEILARGGKSDKLLAFIRDHLQDYLRKAPADFKQHWDASLPAAGGETKELKELFFAAKDSVVGHYPFRSQQTHPVVALENFLTQGYGTCLQQALLASLILEKAKIPHRLVNGATRRTGHVWIQLEDGRVLDPSLKKLGRVEPSKLLPGWSKYGDDVFVIENQVWPYLALSVD